MKEILIFSVVFVVVMGTSTISGIAGSSDYLEPKENEVGIYFNCVEVPLNKILLIRKDYHYCTLKFIRIWTEKDGKEKYAAYETYYQGDGTGNFMKKNVSIKDKTASEFPLRGPFRPFIYQPGDSSVECGPFKLSWNYKRKVGVMPPDKGLGDFGFELAPTPWTDIKEVNTKDPRIKWYRYDEKREKVFISLDKLWKDAENKKEK